jgi:hypothetical protein
MNGAASLLCVLIATRRRVSGECSYRAHLIICGALFVKIGFGVTRKQERRILTITPTLAVPTVISCVPEVSILY